eukprot:TRINITY_DN1648_c0_g2_i4.p1 TRINITY_DN1648_c0_g2~~TRINITY_DN1648_c0_g2_i4.p1  ORF type:complete len:354 (-),score=73.47 TRINITY_DN1648_c0_g2_i4:110-1171(-)
MVKVLLVIDIEVVKNNWREILKGATIPVTEEEIQVEQASWEELTLCVDSNEIIEGRGICNVLITPASGTPISRYNQVRTVKVDFLLIRNRPKTLTLDFTNVLFGFNYAGIPCLNSLFSIYQTEHRVWVFAELLKLKRRLGAVNFPLIPQMYYPNSLHMQVKTPTFPSVIKVAHPHAGAGKIIASDPVSFRDLSSVIALHTDYCSAEPFIKFDHSVRLQKIGNHSRGFKRWDTDWKGQGGECKIEPLDDLPERYINWLNEISKLFGGMEIVSLDLLVDGEGKEWILEMGDTATGFPSYSRAEDNEMVAEVLLDKMKKEFVSEEDEKRILEEKKNVVEQEESEDDEDEVWKSYLG